ncbi:15568_t:CDS:2, partial [Dentiscutata heterogama]
MVVIEGKIDADEANADETNAVVTEEVDDIDTKNKAGVSKVSLDNLRSLAFTPCSSDDYLECSSLQELPNKKHKMSTASHEEVSKEDATGLQYMEPKQISSASLSEHIEDSKE